MSRGLRALLVGAATVEGMTLTAISRSSGGSSFVRLMSARASPSAPSPSSSVSKRLMSMSVDAGVDAARYTTFIKEKVLAAVLAERRQEWVLARRMVLMGVVLVSDPRLLLLFAMVA